MTESKIAISVGGYRADFVDSLPEDLKCMVCHLAYREPVQLTACGHRLCQVCFKTMEKHYHMSDTPLLCPFDKSFIDSSQVFLDRAIGRQVLSLFVKCSNQLTGCSWTGELNQLQDHLLDCALEEITDEKPKLAELQDGKMGSKTSLYDLPTQQINQSEKSLLQKLLDRIERNENATRTLTKEFEHYKEYQSKALETLNQGLDVLTSSLKIMEVETVPDVGSRCSTLEQIVHSIANLLKEVSLKMDTKLGQKTYNEDLTTTRQEFDTKFENLFKKMKKLELDLVEYVDGVNMNTTLETKGNSPASPIELMDGEFPEARISDLEKKIGRLELMNPVSGFFAWTLREFDYFQSMLPSRKRGKLKTSCFGFECRIVLYWTNLKRRKQLGLGFEIVGRTPMTVGYLPFFCDVIISLLDRNGEIMTRKISNSDFVPGNPVEDQEVMLRATIPDFLCFPQHKSFVFEDTLRLFGYFKPFDPSV
eukprot:TCONS_00049607-protein